VLRQTSGSKRKKSPELSPPAAQERHEHEEHGGGAHRQLEAKEMALISSGRSVGTQCIREGEGRGLRQ
jgi:hypothetical protein